METIHVLGFAGTLRKKAYNKGLLRTALQYMPEGTMLEIIELDDLPLFNQDLENDFPTAVQVFREKIHNADAILMAIPEYNYSFSGVLKNAIDWGAWPPSKSVWAGKPVALMGAGGRFGTVRAQLHLRQVLLYLDMPALLKPEVYIEKAWEKFDSDGNLIDEQARIQVKMLMEAFLPWIRQHQPQPSS